MITDQSNGTNQSLSHIAEPLNQTSLESLDFGYRRLYVSLLLGHWELAKRERSRGGVRGVSTGHKLHGLTVMHELTDQA